MHESLSSNSDTNNSVDQNTNTQLPDTDTAGLRLVDIHLNIRGSAILNSINLTIPSSGVTSILGFNGAGKSQLLKLMHGIVTPTSGKVLYDDTPLTSEHRLQQAMVFQKPVLLRRTAKANIDFVLKQRKMPNKQRRNDLLAMVGLEHKASQPARLLSGGEQQRLALARALACKPKGLFLDEATASLDTASTAIIENIMKQQAAKQTKIIFVTHDAAQSARLSNDVVFMHNGRVAEHTIATTFFRQPSSEPAKAYLDGRLYTNDTSKNY